MGLLDFLRHRHDNTRSDNNNGEGHRTTKVPTPNHEQPTPVARPKELILEGSEERQVYTYYGEPLKGTRKGSIFYAEVITKPVVLTSKLTGGTWNRGV